MRDTTDKPRGTVLLVLTLIIYRRTQKNRPPVRVCDRKKCIKEGNCEWKK